MKYGYSNLLGETVEAQRLDYDDCRAFQIVCPICREPVFKGVRNEPATTHYLSHYVSAKAYAAECELRVASFNGDEIERQNAFSRGQKLKLFLGVLPAALNRIRFCDEELVALKRLPRMERSKVLVQLFRAFIWETPACAAEWFDESAVTDFRDDACGMMRGLELATQRRIAKDIFKHLHSAPARENLWLVWKYGYLTALGLWESTKKNHDYNPDADFKTLACMEALIRLPKDRGLELIAEMNSEQVSSPVDGVSFCRLVVLIETVQNFMALALCRIPYLDLLRDLPRDLREIDITIRNSRDPGIDMIRHSIQSVADELAAGKG